MSTSNELGKLSAAEWDELQALADRFAEARGRAPDVEMEPFLPPPGHQLRPLALKELILIDLEACWRRRVPRHVDHYLPRYPELAQRDGLLIQLLYEEFRFRHVHGDKPALSSYSQRHPNLATRLERLLQERPLPDAVENAGLETNATWLEGTLSPSANLKTTKDSEPWLGATALPGASERIDDFELVRILGEGTFGKVYLARQLSLDRLVALKITTDANAEARTLASLEHDHIVQVFSEKVDRQRKLRLLCMQLVGGPTLEQVIAELSRVPREEWSGQAILNVIDRLSQHAATFHPAALRDREVLAQADFIQAVCWLGARMAEALDYAHSQGVLHRDVKPANVLLSQYGRPMLADFNVSLNTHKLSAAKVGLDGLGGLGGTIAYMAPEHLDACNPDGETLPEQVAERSDVFSLGVTLYELLAGERPFQDPRWSGAPSSEAFQAMLDARCSGPPSLRARGVEAPVALDGVIRRCLEPDPAKRYARAAELARALDGCRELRRIERELPAADPITRASLGRPFLALILLGLLPHVAGSAVNITYNWLEIVSHFQTESLREAFRQVALAYNGFFYPLCTGLMVLQVLPVFRVWRALRAGQVRDREVVALARRRSLRWPAWAVGVSALGWLPGGLLFPLGVQALTGEMPASAWGHFLVSFTLSGLIALTYAYFAILFVTLRVLYPHFWADPQDLPQAIESEVGRRPPRLGLFQLLAGVIPLSGAILLVVLGPDRTGYLAFRLLAVSLIVLGMAGFGLALALNKRLVRILRVLAGVRL